MTLIADASLILARTAIVISVASIIFSVVGWFVVHRLTLGREQTRDRDARIRRFAAFLRQWREEVSRTPENDINRLLSDYSTKVPAFRGEQSIVCNDFGQKAEFGRISEHLGGLRYEDITGSREKRARDIIAEAIDQLSDFIGRTRS